MLASRCPQRPTLGRRDSDLADRIELQQEMREDDPNYREEEEDDPVGFGSRKFTKKHLDDDDDDEDGAQLWQPMGQARGLNTLLLSAAHVFCLHEARRPRRLCAV